MPPELISGVFMVAVAIVEAIAAKDRRSAKREREKAQARAERREKESILAMEMMDANCALGLITAKKLAGHKTNGDVEEAMEKAAQARENYEKFIREQAAHQVNKT